MKSTFRAVGVLAAVALVGPSCRSAIEPPPAVSVSDDGECIARHLTFMLKGLRVAFDVVQAVRPNPFAGSPLDSTDFGVPLWGPSSAGSDLGLARRVAESGVLSALASRLAASAGVAGRTMRTPYNLDSALLDSLLARDASAALFDSLADKDTAALRAVFVADSFASAPWDSVRDTLVGRWIKSGGDTTAVFDSLYRFRLADSSVAVTDLETWAFSGDTTLLLVRKRQTHVAGADTVFAHRVKVTGDVAEDTVVSSSPGGRRVLVMKRSDPSREWWNSVDSSVLLEYEDSLTAAGGDLSVIELVDSVYSFPRAGDSQSVVLRRHDLHASGPMERSVSDFAEIILQDEYSLISYAKTERFRNESVKTLRLSGLTDTIAACTLTVGLAPSLPYRLVTSFGTVDSSRWRYTVTPSADWTSGEYAGVRRIDFYRAGGRVQAVEYEVRPAAPAALNGTGVRPPGTTVSTVVYASADRTVLRRWTFCDTGAQDTVRYLWAGKDRDSVFSTTVVSKDGGGWAYGFSRLPLFVRRGAVRRRGADSLEVRDTLAGPSAAFPYRTIEAVLDTNGKGTALVRGPETLEVRIDAGGMSVTCLGGTGCLVSDPVVWTRTGDTLCAADYRDPGPDLRFAASFALNPEGYLDGAFDVFRGTQTSRTAYGSGISVSPLYTGSGLLYGIFTNAPAGDPFSIHAAARVELWGTNSIGSDEDAFLWP